MVSSPLVTTGKINIAITFDWYMDSGYNNDDNVVVQWSTNGTAWNSTNKYYSCLLYTSDAADDMQCVDLGGRRIIKKKKKTEKNKSIKDQICYITLYAYNTHGSSPSRTI
eukprot:TRINITY_DN8400_c0_g1_i3.p3 TRINITY_DN8400_c0_g1~~TRINITY_DN8400_c0_g1_i3.p3  ORF type:complete len:110 (-),score=11.99 TRINITY_DN8400_c0_g1_i3:13-342(-)